MKRSIHRAALLLLLGSAAPALAQVAGNPGEAETGAPAAKSRTLTGVEAWRALAGNTISGRTPDGPYTEYFSPDGVTVDVDRDGKEAGRWVLKGSTVCFTYPDEEGEEDCRTPQVEGAHGAFVDRDGSSYRFEILPGNSEHL